MKSGNLKMIEPLESRLLMAVVSVTNNDDSGAGSLRAAITAANANDTIDFNNPTGAIVLSSTITINKNLAFTGAGKTTTIINGGNAVRLFTINSGVTVTMSDLAMTGANAVGEGGAIAATGANLTLTRVVMSNNVSSRKGAAINAQSGTFAFTDCTFSNNQITGGLDGYGGALCLEHVTMTMTRCTMQGNSINVTATSMMMGASAYSGAMIAYGNTITITNSTFVGNSVHANKGTSMMNPGAQQGAINLAGSTNIYFTNNTVTGNSATVSHGTNASVGGVSVYTDSTHAANFTNNLIAGNTASSTPDLQSTAQLVAAYNLIGNGTGSSLTNGVNNNLVGSGASPINPLLDSAAAHNGGQTHTVALLSGSPAIDAGTSTGAPATDQRGVSRLGATDIGAFELASSNDAPIFTSMTVDDATSESVYTYNITTDDGDDDPVTITATTSLPAWLTLTDNHDGTATLTGTPTNADRGNISVTLRVDDGTDHTDQTFSIAVAAINHGPMVASASDGFVVANSPYQQTIQATDPDDDDLTYTVISKPDWMTITDNHDGTATVSGTPGVADAGLATFSLKVNDGSADSQSQGFGVSVVPLRWQLSNGVLALAGSAADDDIQAWQRGSDELRVLHNGTLKKFSVAGVNVVEIYGFDGNDSISVNVRSSTGYVLAGAGNDLLVGGDQADILTGGGGKDTIVGGGGADRLNGHNGNDKLDGGAGDDRLFGGEGDDALVGGEGIDSCFGGAGNDMIFTRDVTADTILDAEGNNVIDHDELLDILN